MNRVLVTAIGSWSAVAIIESLKLMNYYVVGCDINSKEFLFSSSLVNSFHQVPYATNHSYLDALVTICIDEKIDFLFVLTDPEIDIISEYRTLFKNVILCIPDASSIRIARDKQLLHDFFNTNNLVNVIPTYPLLDIENVKISFPLFLKPKHGRSSEGIFKIENEADLKYVQSNPKFSQHIAQTYLKGSIYTVDIVRNHNSQEMVAIPRCEIIRSTNGAGISIKLCKDEALINLGKIIAEQLSIVGCINIEFIKSEGVYYLMDVNPRFSAGIAFSILAGYDVIQNHLNCFIGKELQFFNNFNELIMTKKFNEVVLN